MLTSVVCIMRKSGCREEYMTITITDIATYRIVGGDRMESGLTQEEALASVNTRLSAAKLDGYKNSVRVALLGTDTDIFTTNVGDFIQLDNLDSLIVSAHRGGEVVYDSVS